MRIIAHRGGAAEQLENSRAAVAACVSQQLAGIEIDVRLTKDNQLILGHDATFARIGNEHTLVHEQTGEQLKTVTLQNGETPLLLGEALELAPKHTWYVELKDRDATSALIRTIKRHATIDIRVVSFNNLELQDVKKHLPAIKTYVLGKSPFELLRLALAHRYSGIGLNFWAMNPLFYWLAKRHTLDVYVYTVNNRLIAWLLTTLYPQIDICTDHPQAFAR